MAKYDVGVTVCVWISKETRAKTREEAEARVLKQANALIEKSGFCWNAGEIKHVQTTDIGALNKITF